MQMRPNALFFHAAGVAGYPVVSQEENVPRPPLPRAAFFFFLSSFLSSTFQQILRPLPTLLSHSALASSQLFPRTFNGCLPITFFFFFFYCRKCQRTTSRESKERSILSSAPLSVRLRRVCQRLCVCVCVRRQGERGGGELEGVFSVSLIPATTALSAPLLPLMVTIVRFGQAVWWQPLRKIHQKRGSPALSHTAVAQT